MPLGRQFRAGVCLYPLQSFSAAAGPADGQADPPSLIVHTLVQARDLYRVEQQLVGVVVVAAPMARQRKSGGSMARDPTDGRPKSCEEESLPPIRGQAEGVGG